MNVSPFSRRVSKTQNGFTLVELMVVIAIIGVLASLAYPSYRSYMNEAKAAEVLSRIHRIGLAYSTTFATAPHMLEQAHDLSSDRFGLPPLAFPELSTQYTELHGIEFSSQLLNHLDYFDFTEHEEFAVLFLKAVNDEGYAILNALDHVTESQHVFATPTIMLVALGHAAVNTNTAGNSDQLVSSKAPAEALPPAQAQNIIEPSVDTPTTDKDGIAATPESSENTKSGEGTSSTTAGDNDLAPTASRSTEPPQTHTVSPELHPLGWPPGWAKHPQNHQQQTFQGNQH